MSRRSGSTLFLMEQLIVVAIFAICAAACVRILTESYFMATKTRDLSNAIHAAESGAECFKAASGDIGKVARIIGGTSSGDKGADAVIIYYDKNWSVCGEGDAVYKMSLTRGTSGAGASLLLPGELSVEKLTGEVLIAFTVSARGILYE